MKNYVNEISKVMFDYDIEGLADLGCPEDEYDSEAKIVFENINANMTVEEVANICRVVYSQMFFGNYNLNQFIGMAEEILKIIG